MALPDSLQGNSWTKKKVLRHAGSISNTEMEKQIRKSTSSSISGEK